MLDDTLLGDPRALAALDTGGVLRSAATAGAQVRSTAHAAAGGERRGAARAPPPRARAAAPAGRGRRRVRHARRPARRRRARCRSCCPTTVPSWIGPLDVVVAHTADASDADLAESVGRAVRRGAEVVLSAPGDGPVASAGAGRVRLVEPRIPVPPGLDLPRALAVGLTTVAALDLLPTPFAPASTSSPTPSTARPSATTPATRRS